MNNILYKLYTNSQNEFGEEIKIDDSNLPILFPEYDNSNQESYKHSDYDIAVKKYGNPDGTINYKKMLEDRAKESWCGTIQDMGSSYVFAEGVVVSEKEIKYEIPDKPDSEAL